LQPPTPKNEASVGALETSAMVNTALMPDVKEKLTSLGLTAQSGTPVQFSDHLKSETDKIFKIVKSANIKFE
jgi:tripartite-type tricarboxylate transporter receptor subunit TctC